MATTEGERSGSLRNQVRYIYLLRKTIQLLSIVHFNPQILAALCISLTAMRFGANMGITSGMVYAFEKDNDDYPDMTLEEASWLRENI